MKTKVFLLLLCILMHANGIFAEKVHIGQLYYELDRDYKTATVVHSGNSTYDRQTYVGNVVIPSSISHEWVTYDVKRIGIFAFQYSMITSVVIPNSVTEIGKQAFNGCRKLTSVILSNNIKRIECGTFEDCSSLKSVKISNKVRFIEGHAFKGCTALTSLFIPESVRKIGNDAFYNVYNVTYTGVAEGSPWGAKNMNKASNGYLLFSDISKTTLESCSKAAEGVVVIPEGTVVISAEAFEKCSTITSIVIPNTVSYIEYGAFKECTNLRTLTVPNSVKTIEVESFSGCQALQLRLPQKFKGRVNTTDCTTVTYY